MAIKLIKLYIDSDSQQSQVRLSETSNCDCILHHEKIFKFISTRKQENVKEESKA